MKMIDIQNTTSADLKLGYNISDNNRVSLTYGLIDAKTNYDNIESYAFEYRCCSKLQIVSFFKNKNKLYKYKL